MYKVQDNFQKRKKTKNSHEKHAQKATCRNKQIGRTTGEKSHQHRDSN